MTLKSLPDNTSGRKEKCNRSCRAFVRSSGFFLLPVLTGFPPFVLTDRFKFRRLAKLAVVIYSKRLEMMLIYIYMLLGNHGNHYHGIKL